MDPHTARGMITSMPMVFTNDHSTPLFSSQWTPTTAEGYAGTCIFLIALAVISRGLSVWRHAMEIRWHEQRYAPIADDQISDREKQCDYAAEKSDEVVLITHERDERVQTSRISHHSSRSIPWRLGTDLPRACIFVLQAGVGYLL
jgi:hypothetical protein